MFLSEARITDIAQLRDRIWGEVITPYDSNWDEARQVFNLSTDQQPAAIVYAESAEDVAAAVRFARKHDMRVAPQTTGHNAGPLTPNLENTLIVKTTRMKGVEINTETRIARVQAGTVWGEVTSRLEGTGLAALHGSSPTVGVVGYSLTGGVGWQARKHGMQVNQITVIELVNEFGETIRASEDVHPDLFWALRGGGGNFGVVTAMEFRLVPTPQAHAGMLIWPWEEAEDVFTTWLEMLPQLPEEFTTTCRLVQMPPFEEIPAFLRGRQLVIFNGAHLGDREEAAKLLAPLRALNPEIDTFEDVDPSALSLLHMDPEDPIPYAADHMLLDMVDAQTVKELVAAAGAGSDSPMGVVELRHTGGALSRCEPGSGARTNLPGEMLYFTVGALMPGLPPEALDAQAGKVRAILEPHKAEQDYLNFSEEAGKLGDFFDPHTLSRLAKIKAEYDQSNRFQGNFEL
ncbi:MAG: FAD-binding oxidoreductase [Thermoleophilaceae bacterium]|nr:FAD-binding oxidoreductase [Thermoleophilaceae bacterium]